MTTTALPDVRVMSGGVEVVTMAGWLGALVVSSVLEGLD